MPLTAKRDFASGAPYRLFDETKNQVREYTV
jgi:hypothetical protein